MSDGTDTAIEPAAWHGRRIVVLGDVMLDRFVYGDVERISPEGPIPVLRHSREAAMLGGAGNVARNIATLGGRPVLIAAIGADAAGDSVMAAAPSAEAPANDGDAAIEGVFVRRADVPTTVKTRFVAGGQQLLRVDVEQVRAVDAATAQALLAALAARIVGAGALVLSDYAKGVLEPEVIAGAIALARAAGVPVVVDPKRSDVAVYAGADVITPNAAEARAATGCDTRDDEGAAAAAYSYRTMAGARAVVLTRGAQGMTIVAGDGAPLHLPTTASEVFDVSGAGDTVIATLALALAAGASVPAAAAVANVAAGVAVAKQGTAAVHAAELARALFDRSVASRDDKVLSGEALLARVRRWRAEGRRIGFTNGCFDLIHPGHITTLTQSRARCDRLIVGLNSDESVRRLKGPTRPVQVETARAIVLASMAAVDAVVLFGEDTPRELIAAIRPDVLTKGGDYALDEIVGADLVTGWGGEVATIPLADGHSTTAMIAKAR